MTTDDTRHAIWDSKPLAAFIVGIFNLLAVALGYWLAMQSRLPESYEVTVRSSDYPFPSTNIQINDGDEVEIRVLAANNTILDCGLGRTSPIGMIENEQQKFALSPTVNLCALIGQIGTGPYFAIGAYDKSTSLVSGKLFLGLNDLPQKPCNASIPETCYADNLGKLSAKVTIIRRR